MSRVWGLFALLLLPTPAFTAEPTFSGQVQSIDRMIGDIGEVYRRLLQPEVYREASQAMMQSLPLEQLSGVDRSKPFAFYGSIAEDPFATRLVLVVPIQKEADFIGMLKSVGLDLKAKENGITSIVVPGLPIQTFLKFVDGYAYISMLNASPLDDKERIPVKTLIRADEPGLAVLRIRPGLIPDMYKDVIQTVIAQQADDMERNTEGILPAKQAATAIGTLMTRWVSMLFSQTNEVAIRLGVEPKTRQMMLELDIAPNAKSRLATSLTEYQPVAQTFAGMIRESDALSGRFSIPLFNDEMKELSSGLMWTGQLLVKMGEAFALSEFSVELLKALNRQGKTGSLDVAGALTGPNKDGHFTLTLGLALRDTRTMEQALRKAVGEAQPGIQDRVKFATSKVGEVDVHELEVASLLPPAWQNVFGESNVYVAFARQGLVIAFGPEGRDRLNDALNTKPVVASIATLDGRTEKVLKLVDRLDARTGKEIRKAFRTTDDALPLFSLDTTTNERLKVRFNVSGLLFATLGIAQSKTVPADSPE